MQIGDLYGNLSFADARINTIKCAYKHAYFTVTQLSAKFGPLKTFHYKVTTSIPCITYHNIHGYIIQRVKFAEHHSHQE